MDDLSLDIPGNAAVLDRLQETVASGTAIAFVGAGASAGLYPVWSELLERLMSAALDGGFASEAQLEDWRSIAASQPEEVAAEIRHLLPAGTYSDLLHRLFAPRRDPPDGACTAVHAALLRAPFRGYVTTNYDPGLLEARHRFRPAARPTGVATWRDADALNRWLTGAIFAEEEAPVLFLHGVFNRADTIVLGEEDYRRAYAEGGPYPQVMAKLWGQERLVFVGFAFADAWIRRLAGDALAGSAAARSAPRHLAILALPAAGAYTAQRRLRAQRLYNAEVFFYRTAPASGGGRDRPELRRLLESLAAAPARAGRGVASPGSSASSPPAAGAARGRLQEVLKRGRLRCGCVKHPPLCDFEWQGEEAVFAGLYVEIARAAAAQAGLAVDFAPVDWTELPAAFQAPLDLDLVLSVFETRQRLSFGDFTAPFHNVGVSGVVKRGDRRFATVADLAGTAARIVVTKGEIGWEYAVFELRLPRRRLIVIENSDLTEMAASVVHGKADIAICDDVTCVTMARLHPELERVFGAQPLYLCKNAIMVPQGEPDLAEWVLQEFRRARATPAIRALEDTILAQPDWVLRRFT